MAKRKTDNQTQPEQATSEQVTSEQTMSEQATPEPVFATQVASSGKQATPEVEAMETGIENQQEATLKGDEQATPGQTLSTREVQNWHGLRERTEKAERERDEFFRRLQKLEQTKSEQAKSSSEDLDLKQTMSELNDDDLVEAKHLKSYDRKNAQRIAMLEAQLIESRLKSEYSDFDKVVNVDTLGMLRDIDPELAESITANPNIYSKAVTAYKSIKRYGLISEDHYMKEREKVHANVTKPRPVSSVSPQQGESPLSRANAFAEGLTPELAKELWKEMQQSSKKS